MEKSKFDNYISEEKMSRVMNLPNFTDNKRNEEKFLTFLKQTELTFLLLDHI